MAHSSSVRKSSNKINKALAWWRGVPGEEHVVKLDASNFDRVLSNANRPAFIMFYAQWCGYSISARNPFAAVADQFAREGNPILIGAVDSDESKEICSRYREVNGYPCFLYFSKGSPKLQYLQQRTRDGFYNWIIRNQHGSHNE